MTIRPALRTDLSGVVENERCSFTTPWSRTTFAELLGRPTVLFRVAEDDEGALLAHGVLWHVQEEGELANLAVVPAARGRGVGGQLLDALLAEAGVRGVSRVFLEVRESNQAALRLYRRRGFEPVGRRRDYYRNPREDARVLCIEL